MTVEIFTAPLSTAHLLKERIPSTFFTCGWERKWKRRLFNLKAGNVGTRRVLFDKWIGEFLKRGIKMYSPFMFQDTHAVHLVGSQSCSGLVTISTNCSPLQRGVFVAEILSLFNLCMGAPGDRKLSFLVCWSLDQKQLYSYPLNIWLCTLESLMMHWRELWGTFVNRGWVSTSCMQKRE